MDDWTYPYPDVDPPFSQPRLLDRDGRAIEDRDARAGQAEAGRVADLEQRQAVDVIGSHADAYIPFSFASPPCAALTF